MRRVWIEIPNIENGLIARLSPSMRRVWIEIAQVIIIKEDDNGHPPCGGCGLKSGCLDNSAGYNLSPSMRRVWIEISVWKIIMAALSCHPPCGGCGLKFSIVLALLVMFQCHPPCGGCGLRRKSASIPPYPSHSPHKLLAMIPYLAL